MPIKGKFSSNPENLHHVAHRNQLAVKFLLASCFRFQEAILNPAAS